MAYVVTEPCFGCKYTDCVVVCPTNCFHEGEQMLYIDLLADLMFAETYSEAIYIPGPKELFPSYKS